jgi:hypothetical protein
VKRLRIDNGGERDLACFVVTAPPPLAGGAVSGAVADGLA